MNLRPLGDRVVVKPVEREEKTKSGIVLPDTAKEKPQEGIVEAVETGRILDNGTKIPMELKVGDKILYAKYAGNEFKLHEIEYLIVSEKDVLAIVSSNGMKQQGRRGERIWRKQSHSTLRRDSTARRASTPLPRQYASRSGP